ncbi:glycosyltransferase [Roseiflexus sp.]|uniref:glycosyltransferase n=1 Tax=Roseiflexus sp. TaxID=2562120 RepID=UPI00398A564E
MRLLMLNNEFPPLGGGTGTVNKALLQRFARVADLEIDLFTAALGRTPEREQFSERIQIYKVPVNNRDLHHSSNRELLMYAAGVLPAALARHRAIPYDFCFAWSAVPAGGAALALRYLTGLPYLVRVCGPDIPGFEERYGWLYPLLTPFIRAVWRQAHLVVAKCDDEAAMIRQIDPSITPTIVPNGVDVAAFHVATPRLYGPLRIICVARLIERKGQHHLLLALRRLRDAGVAATVEFVGTGDAAQTYRAEAERLGVADLVTFAGYVPREHIAERYASADVFVLPSYNEGMSVATLEAMAAGLPLVVTRTGGTKELVHDGENGLTFAWSDIETLTQHLMYLASNRQVLQRMGAASRQRATQMSWEMVALRYLDIFCEVARESTPEKPHAINGIHVLPCPQTQRTRREPYDQPRYPTRPRPDPTAAAGVSARLRPVRHRG